MTKQKLSQFTWLKHEINILTQKIIQIESYLEGKHTNKSNLTFLGTNQVLASEFRSELAHLKKVLQQKKSAAITELAALESYIGHIHESQIRTIFTLRYIDNLNWTQVAWRLGNNTADSVRMIHNRFLERQTKDAS